METTRIEGIEDQEILEMITTCRVKMHTLWCTGRAIEDGKMKLVKLFVSRSQKRSKVMKIALFRIFRESL